MKETIDWSPLGDITYRKVPVYAPMQWSQNLDLSKYLVAISQCGGLIAMIKDETITERRSASKKPILSVFSASGAEISSFPWNSGLVIGLEWTNTEDLLCIQEDGQVLIYSMFCNFLKTFAMGNECRESNVRDCRTFMSGYGTGLVVLSGSHRFYLVSNVYDPKLRRMADIPGLRNPPSSWCVLPSEREPKILAANEHEIYLLKWGEECTQQYPTSFKARVTSFIEMTSSLNGRHVALYTESGIIWMGSSDLQEKYCEFNTNNGSRPKELIWCCDHNETRSAASDRREKATSAIVVYWPRTVLLVGMKKDWARFQVDEPQDGMSSNHLKLDLDGVHLLSSQKHEFLQRVPNETEGIFKVGSMASGALLHAAAKEYEKESQKADEYIRVLLEKNELQSAIEQCMLGAEEDFNPETQKILLRAASFGKAFHPHPAVTEKFVDVCRILRVLNNIREEKTGILLTAKQLEFLSAGTVIDRLVARRNFAIAFHICKYLRIPENLGSSRVLAHWACYKVQQSDMDDDTTARAIKNKLRSAKGVSYASIAEKAVDCGKNDLAVKLLEYEQRASEQVRLLIKLRKPGLALEKAVLSGNTDLTHEAIGRLRERTTLSEFLLTIRQYPVAYHLYIKSRREQDPDMLKNLLEQEDDFLELAHCHVRESYRTFSPEDRFLCLQQAAKNFSNARDEFCTKASEEQQRLIRQQILLEEESEQSYVETSIHDTLNNLLLAGNVKKAEQLRKEFKVSDKRWWTLRITTLAQLGLFNDLESFAKSKKSPVGYLPFVEACAKYRAPHEIVKYINKVPQDQRVLALIKSGNIRQAGELALQTKSSNDLDMVLKRCGAESRDIAERVVAMLNQLQR